MLIANKIRCAFLLVAGLLLASSAPRSLVADPLVFTLVPSGGVLTAAPGTTIGWGYTLFNNSTNWIELTNVNAPGFSTGTALSVFDFPILPPGDTVTESWVQDIAGLYQFTFDPLTVAGTIETGTFVLDANLWTINPLQPGAVPVTTITESQKFSVTASGTPPSPVPEPSSIVLLLLGGVGLVGVIIRRHSTHAARDLGLIRQSL